MTRIVIRHSAGTKASQVEEFPLEHVRELLIGRDPQASLRFDPERDDLVSRRHARIVAEPGERPAFRIIDLESSNGVFVNGTRIAGEAALLPGDEVRLGAGGPAFIFDLEPRPDHLMARTRLGAALPGPKATIISGLATAGAEPRPVAGSAPRSGVGRATVERLIAYQGRTSRRAVLAGFGLVLAVSAAGGGWLLAGQRDVASAADQARITALAEAGKLRDQMIRQVSLENERRGARTPAELAAEYSDANVLIRVNWALHHRDTGRQVFHRRVTATMPDGSRAQVPAYIRIAEGRVVPWLTLEPENADRIGGSSRGSGFVMSNNGFILTNRHVAAKWLEPYRPRNPLGAILPEQTAQQAVQQAVAQQAAAQRGAPQAPQAVRVMDALDGWAPTNEVIFSSAAPVRIHSALPPGAGFGGNLIGRPDITVHFPGQRLGAKAQLIRASDRADVALLKVEIPGALPHVRLAPREHRVTHGQPIAVMGFPGFAADRIDVVEGNSTGISTLSVDTVPQVTLTEGIVARVQTSQGEAAQATGRSEPGLRSIHPLGDMFMLTAVSTGGGNSGGPIFDANGQVIGIFTAGSTEIAGQAPRTFGLPIHYAHEIIGTTVASR